MVIQWLEEVENDVDQRKSEFPWINAQHQWSSRSSISLAPCMLIQLHVVASSLDIHPVKKQPSQDVLHGDAAKEELGLVRLVSSYTLPHQNSQPGGRGQQTARSKVLSRCARDTWSVTWCTSRPYSRFNKISHGGLWRYDRFTLWRALLKELRVLAHR